MANTAKLEVVFLEPLSTETSPGVYKYEGASLQFAYVGLQDILEDAVPERYTIEQFPYLNESLSIQSTAAKYAEILNDDYGNIITMSIITTNVTNDTVVIEPVNAADYDSEFSDFFLYTGGVPILGVLLNYTYTPPVAPPLVYEVDEITVQAADVIGDRNTKVRYNVLISNGSVSYSIQKPIAKPSNLLPPYLAENELFFDHFRNPEIIYPLETNTYDINDDLVSGVYDFHVPIVELWAIDNVVVTESQSGATVVCNLLALNTETIDISVTQEFSIDGITWFTSNTFTGVLAGSWTMYARDEYGASFQAPFTVEGVEEDKPEPQFFISDINPFRFVPVTEFSCEISPFWDNALFSELVRTQYTNCDSVSYNQIISDCDTIITQISTNYDNINVSIVDSDGVEVLNPTATLLKEYILQEDKRDAFLFQTDDGKTAVAFNGGKIYDPTTGLQNGTYTNPSKSLYPFALQGVGFSISEAGDFNGDYDPIEEYYDQNSGWQAIKLDRTFTGNLGEITCQCLTFYNEKQYNTWEFTTVGTALDEGCYQTIITANDDDPRYQDVEWISEPFTKLASTINTVAFDYSHSENVYNIDFTTNVLFRLRVEGRFIASINDENDTSFQSDDGEKILQKSTVTRLTPFESGLIPFYIAEKLAKASGMSRLTINGRPYVKGEDNDYNSFVDQRNPLAIVTREYQDNDITTISEEVGLATETRQVLGTSGNTVLGITNVTQ